MIERSFFFVLRLRNDILLVLGQLKKFLFCWFQNSETVCYWYYWVSRGIDSLKQTLIEKLERRLKRTYNISWNCPAIWCARDWLGKRVTSLGSFWKPCSLPCSLIPLELVINKEPKRLIKNIIMFWPDFFHFIFTAINTHDKTGPSAWID